MAQTGDARAYERQRVGLYFLDLVISFVVMGLFSLAGPARWLASALVPLAGDGYGAVAVFTTLCLLGYCSLFLPLDYLRGHRLEHRFDLSTQSPGSWAMDWCKGLGLKLLFINILAMVLFGALRLAGDQWWIWAGFAWLLFGIVLSHAFPVLIFPIFFKVTPLEDARLKERILALTERMKARVVGVYRFNMSKKTKKANALFAGLGRSKRIILGDTLLEKFDEDEIEAVLAHEFGHCALMHVPKQVLGSTLLTFFGLWLVHVLLQGIIGELGFESPAEVGALPAIGFFLSALAFAATPLSNGYSRRCERQADRFALKHTRNLGGFCRAMEKLGTQNLANPNPHPLVEFVLYSHPGIAKRIKDAKAIFPLLSKASVPSPPGPGETRPWDVHP